MKEKDIRKKAGALATYLILLFMILLAGTTLFLIIRMNSLKSQLSQLPGETKIIERIIQKAPAQSNEEKLRELKILQAEYLNISDELKTLKQQVKLLEEGLTLRKEESVDNEKPVGLEPPKPQPLNAPGPFVDKDVELPALPEEKEPPPVTAPTVDDTKMLEKEANNYGELKKELGDLNERISELERILLAKNEKLQQLEELVKNQREQKSIQQQPQPVIEQKVLEKVITVKKDQDIQKELPNMIYYDDFIDNSHEWLINDSPVRSTLINNGKLEFEHKKAEGTWMIWNGINNPLQYEDYRIYVVLQRNFGKDSDGYGIIWKIRDNMNFFSFKISGSGHYRLDKVVNGTKYSILPWMFHTSINQGNSINVISIRKHGNKFEFEINDNKIYTVAMDDLSGNNIGFIIDGRQKISVDLLYLIKL